MSTGDASSTVDADEAPPGLVPDPPPAAGAGYTTSAAGLYFVEKDRSFKVLIAMCRGLKGTDGKQILDLAIEPWRSIKPAANIKLSTADYKVEIHRRWLLSLPPEEENQSETSANKTKKKQRLSPRSRAWNVEALQTWLDDNPITNELDVDFLKRALILQRNAVEGAMDAEHNEKLLLEKSWQGKYPFLRMIHCLIDFKDIKRAYMYRDGKDPTRQSVENRNSTDKQRETVWDLISHKWNDKSFEPTTYSLLSLHSDFDEERLFFHQVESMSKADPVRVKKKFSNMIVELGRIIGNWERSGQGDEGVEPPPHPDDEERKPGGALHGSLENRSTLALSKLPNFFKASQLYLLYLWQLLYTHKLLGTTLQRLSAMVSSGNGGLGVPSVILPKRRGPADDESDTGTIASSITSMLVNHTSLMSQGLRVCAESNIEAAKIACDHNRAENDRLAAHNRIENERLSNYMRLAELRTSIATLKKDGFAIAVEISKLRPDQDATATLLNEGLKENQAVILDQQMELLRLTGRIELPTTTEEEEDDMADVAPQRAGNSNRNLDYTFQQVE
jgi:hypothetical protein